MAETNAARQKCQGQEAMGESRNCFPEPEVKYVIIMCFGKAFYISVSSKVFFEYRCSNPFSGIYGRCVRSAAVLLLSPGRLAECMCSYPHCRVLATVACALS